MSAPFEEVTAAKAFLSELPIGIASSIGIASVRTLLAHHDLLESTIRGAQAALGDGYRAKLSPASVVEALAKRTAELSAALEASQAAAALSLDQATKAEARFQELAGLADQTAETNRLLAEERQRSLEAEMALIRARETVRASHVEIANLKNQIAELLRTRDEQAESEAKQREEAEAEAVAKQAIIAGQAARIGVLEGQIEEASRIAVGKENDLRELKARIDALNLTLKDRDTSLLEQSNQIEAGKVRIEDLALTADARADEIAALQRMVESLKNELDERRRCDDLLSTRIEELGHDLEAAGARIEFLSDAVRPFAEMAECYELAEPTWVVDSGWCEDRRHRIVAHDFRQARDAIGNASDKGERSHSEDAA
jgi:chromosome segregation ATPase